ncbi:MAG: hypothetical protein SV966_08315 [Actinomycetota bacterium]|nr:hypothetical protein [Actinomycetota bacterium]
MNGIDGWAAHPTPWGITEACGPARITADDDDLMSYRGHCSTS